MSNKTHTAHLDDDICVHIFAASGAMVGVCLTVVSVLRIIVGQHRIDLIGQDMLALNTVIYLATSLTAYFGLRTRKLQRNPRLERAADLLFLLGLILTTLTTTFIACAMSCS
ncbi:hypothetical protein ACA097_00745 [Pseudomonas sp. QL9]|uniref:Uncharacterized protein n=1 Tax=Pseudomonas knackmussii (strain DSM 6978 / CCUG 54928 / LMG 23759 / B13) TaxID=1301098 RepID=A0A024HGI2_PSEKB|nr:hypothetical protein [Pseudomonas knackmussii]CDF83759.1 hypothetical protein PKB_2412 [Pseudomonas knackmussii B13]